MRIERLLAAGASIKGTARKFEIDYHALRRHWINHVSVEERAAYIAGAGAIKDRLETVVADESLALIDHYRIVRGGLYKSFAAATEAIARIVSAVAPFPEAREAVITALRDLEAASDPTPALEDHRVKGVVIDD